MPKRVKNYILGNHISYFVANLVEGLDFGKIDQKYRHIPGEAVYPRQMLLK